MNNAFQNFQYKDSEHNNITWLNLRKIDYMAYVDLFDLILNQYSSNLEEYKNSKYFNAMEKRIWVPDYNKTRDKKKSLEKILQTIPKEIFNLHRETLIPRCVNHFYEDKTIFWNLVELYSITESEISDSLDLLSDYHEYTQNLENQTKIKDQESIVKKRVTKITDGKTIFQSIIGKSYWVWDNTWLAQSKIRGNIEWLDSQEYINRAIEKIYNSNPDFFYKNTDTSSSRSYLISKELLDFIVVIYKSLTDWLGFINQEEIDNYLKNKNITLSEYLLQNYTNSKDLIEKKESNVFWIKKTFYRLNLI